MSYKIRDSERYEFSAKMNIFFNFLESLKKTDQTYLVYGYGTVGKMIGAILREQAIGFVDKDRSVVSKANKTNVVNIHEIASLGSDKILISVLGREKEIAQELQEFYGVTPDKIVVLPIGRDFQSEIYQKIYVNSSYSPWWSDQKFLNLYDQIRNNTLVDIFRCYEIFTLVEQVSKLQEGALIEIGVFKGGTGAVIASQAKACTLNEKVYLCDTFEGVVKSSELDTHYVNGEHNTSQTPVEELLKVLDLDNVVLLKGIFPDDTAHFVEDTMFRLCHIDVDVYQSAKDIMDWVWPRMVTGGVVLYDDFGFSSCEGIKKHVEEQMSLQDRLVIYNLNGHAIVVKLY